MFEGLFSTICELDGDSSTQTLKSYRSALNKYQVTRLVSSEIKSFNYGEADGTGTDITTLTRRYILFIYKNIIFKIYFFI